MARKPTGGKPPSKPPAKPPAKPPTSRDSGQTPSSIAGKALANGGKLTKAETVKIAASVLSQNQKP